MRMWFISDTRDSHKDSKPLFPMLSSLTWSGLAFLCPSKDVAYLA